MLAYAPHQRLTVHLKPLHRSGVKHIVGKVITHSNLGQQKTPCKLWRSTPWYFKLQWMSCGRSSYVSKSIHSWSLTPSRAVLVIAVELTGMSLSITRGRLMEYMPRLGVSLVSQARMFGSMPNVSGSPWSRCVWLEFYLSLPPLIGGGVWSVSREDRNAVWSFWWTAVQGSCRSAIHLPFVSQSHYICFQVSGGEAAPVGSGFLWWHWPMHWVCFHFFEEDSRCSGPSSSCVFSATPSFRKLSLCSRVGNVTPIPKSPRSSWVTNYRPISWTPILSMVFERLVSVCLERFVECRGVRLKKRSRRLWYPSVCGTHLTRCFGDGAGG